ncbi:MAG: type II toxin-antitoxin system HicB family antitoxin [Selenomonas sp.]|nr:type II toxin-antitoxin system HicB family antitoxin [Selenomonas sp.]
MKPMEYKGYAASVEYSAEDECFWGRIAGIRDLITFEGESVKELLAAFHEAVDFYLKTCAERGEQPNRSYSGKIMLRLEPALHARLAAQAQAVGKSLNQYAVDVLANA